MTTVKVLSRWTGWCDPCHVERPLALTSHGAHGLSAWWGGVGAEDRRLVLACEVCGEWQPVPLDEESDPEPTAPLTDEVTVAASSATAPSGVPSPLATLPTAINAARVVVLPRAQAPAVDEQGQVLDLVSQGLDILSTP